MVKPKIFIGSSVEGLNVAKSIQGNLEHDALCTIWHQGIFELTGNTLDNLLDSLERFEYGIFVFTPDDLIKIRDEEKKTIRDNVLFEFGLFVGKLGKKKVFFIMPKDIKDLHLPTDLAGITPGTYDHNVTENELLSSLGPFCNKVMRQIRTFQKDFILSSHEDEALVKGSIPPAVKEVLLPISEQDDTNEDFKNEIELGVYIDNYNNAEIHLSPTVFFENRICQAFPGIRGFKWFEDPKICAKRLNILLKTPVHFENVKFDGFSDPIWWWRGNENMYIHDFTLLSETKCLMNIEEIEISRIAVYHSASRHYNFVYIESKAENQIGINHFSKEEIASRTKSYGFCREEYALFNNYPISRGEYDDGHAVIEDEIVDTMGEAELRVRFLSNYNFLISAKTAALNNDDFDNISAGFLNGFLNGKTNFEEFINIIERLPTNNRMEYRANQ